MNGDCSMWVGKLRKPCRSYDAVFLFLSLAGKCNWPWWFAIRASAFLQGHWAASLAVKSALCPACIYALRQFLFKWKNAAAMNTCLTERRRKKNLLHMERYVHPYAHTAHTCSYINHKYMIYMHTCMCTYVRMHACDHAQRERDIYIYVHVDKS